MYKILIRLKTYHPWIYSFYTENGEVYETSSFEEVEAKTMEILENIGNADVKVIKDHDFYVKVTEYHNEVIDEKDVERLEQLLTTCGYGKVTLSNVGDYKTKIIWGTKPEKDIPTYTVELMTSSGIEIASPKREVKEGSDAIFELQIEDDVQSFHISINGEVFSSGLPSYVEYKDNLLTIKDIHNDLVVVLIKD